jgi:hypothetical protein
MMNPAFSRGARVLASWQQRPSGRQVCVPLAATLNRIADGAALAKTGVPGKDHDLDLDLFDSGSRLL